LCEGLIAPSFSTPAGVDLRSGLAALKAEVERQTLYLSRASSTEGETITRSTRDGAQRVRGDRGAAGARNPGARVEAIGGSIHYPDTADPAPP
jgi:hypothetical protein